MGNVEENVMFDNSLMFILGNNFSCFAHIVHKIKACLKS